MNSQNFKDDPKNDAQKNGGRNGLECTQFEALLADALDGVLSPGDQAAFDAHALSCTLCGPMLMEAREGRLWLETLEDVEPPKNLIHNILAATTMAESAPGAVPVASRTKKRGFRPLLSGFFRSRVATSFSMAFFSLSLTLTVAGVRVSDLAKVDWHPTALGKSIMLQYTHVESAVVKYYENMRLVNEVESRVKELRKATATTDEDNDKKDKPKDKDKKGPNDTSGRPEQHPDYSMEREDSVIAQSTTKREGAQL
jgi:putative zinc finger protein